MIWKFNFTKICLFSVLLFPIGFITMAISWTVALPFHLNTPFLVLGMALMMVISPSLIILSLTLGIIKKILKK